MIALLAHKANGDLASAAVTALTAMAIRDDTVLTRLKAAGVVAALSAAVLASPGKAGLREGAQHLAELLGAELAVAAPGQPVQDGATVSEARLCPAARCNLPPSLSSPSIRACWAQTPTSPSISQP